MANLRILSRSDLPFADRIEAGRLLAYQLKAYKGQKAVVLGILRGGIIVAREIARELDADLDILLARKLRTPGHEELAMGAITENGTMFLNQGVIGQLGIPDYFIQEEKNAQLTEIKRRTDVFRHFRPKIALKDRVVIVADDGVATGATTQAALWAVRAEQPQKLIAALPVGPEQTIIRLSAEVDEMICLRCPPDFSAVGQFYHRFYPIEDEDVISILKEEKVRKI